MECGKCYLLNVLNVSVDISRVPRPTTALSIAGSCGCHTVGQRETTSSLFGEQRPGNGMRQADSSTFETNTDLQLFHN